MDVKRNKKEIGFSFWIRIVSVGTLAGFWLLGGLVWGQQRPNVLLILTDDQGYGDVGFHENPFIQTPTLDSLAGKSIRMRQFYVSPVCAPTRASLMSGRYSHETGVYDTYRGGSIMASEVQTLAEMLRGAGYQTGMAGKWHLGDAYPYRPEDQGFEEVLMHGGGGLEQPGDFYENFSRKDSSYFDPYLIRNGKKFQAEGYVSDVFTDAAIEFVSEEREQPFFFYLAYNAPHTPLEVPQKYLDRYDKISYSQQTFGGKGADDIDHMSAKDREDARKVYAMVSNIDDNLARLFAALRESGQDDNTLIIFLTDNGPQQRRYNGGLYGRKGSVYEGGVHVPCLWRMPPAGNFPIDQEISHIAAHMDILPTLGDWLHVPVSQEVDGVSLMPLLRQEQAKLERPPLFFKWMRGYPRSYHNMAVRSGNWKLTGAYTFESEEDFDLFQLDADPEEGKDLQDVQPQLVDSFTHLYDEWLAAQKASPYLRTPLAISLLPPDGTPVRLNRNEWRGPGTQSWGSMEAHGHWWVKVPQSGTYTFEVFFQDSLPGDGLVQLWIGPAQRSQRVKPVAGQNFQFEIHLAPGTYLLEPSFYCYWPEKSKGIYGPYDVTVTYEATD